MMRHGSLTSGAVWIALGSLLLLGGCSWFTKKEVSASASPATTSDRLGAGDVRSTDASGGRTGGSLDGYRAIEALRDIHFEFDRYEVRTADVKLLEDGAAWIRSNPRMLVLIEGHADERGTNEYNMTLADRRAKSTINFLVTRGVPATRLSAISYGSERPDCRDKSEECFARNRRAHFLVKPE